MAKTSLAWRIHTLPLYARLVEVLYEGENNSLPSQTTGCIGFLKLDGYGARDTTENMCCLTRFLQDHTWDTQLVSVFVDTTRTKSHWPAKLATAVRPPIATDSSAVCLCVLQAPRGACQIRLEHDGRSAGDIRVQRVPEEQFPAHCPRYRPSDIP